jgi:hypothetical protein
MPDLHVHARAHLVGLLAEPFGIGNLSHERQQDKQ